MAIGIPIGLLVLTGFAFLVFSSDTVLEEKVILTADKAPRVEKSTPQVSLLEQAKIAISENRIEDAKILLADAKKDTALQAEAWYLLGELAKSETNLPEAFDCFQQAIAITPAAPYYFARCQVYLAWNNLEEALKDSGLAHKQNPSNPLYSNADYLIRIQAGEIANVNREIELKAQLQLSNSINGWIMGAAGLLLHNEQFDEAVQVLAQAKKRLPKDNFQTLMTFPAIAKYAKHPKLIILSLGSENIKILL